MKLLAGMVLFLLCALAGEGWARRLLRREQALSRFHDLIREIGDRQLLNLVSFREAAVGCPASAERTQLLALLKQDGGRIPLLTGEEQAQILAYARSESRSVSSLRTERDALLTLLERGHDSTKEERMGKGQVYRSVGYLFGVAILLLVL